MEHITCWEKLLRDTRVWLGPLRKNQTFRYFVDHIVPEIIEDYLNLPATFDRWIEVQYKIAKGLADISCGSQNESIAKSLAGHKNKDLFLLVHDTTEEAYALQVRGLFEDEYEKMCSGDITVGDLYQKNPVAFFGPLLMKNERTVQ